MTNGATSADHLRTTPFGPPLDVREALSPILERLDLRIDACLAARLIGTKQEQDEADRVMSHVMSAFEAYCTGRQRQFHDDLLKLQGELRKIHERGLTEGYNLMEQGRREMASERGRKVCYVYFIQSGAGEIKIGKAIDVRKRLSGLQTSHPHPLTVLAVTTGGKPVELGYHARFAQHRLHGEWFAPHADILAEVDRLRLTV